jgi:hypothetical protein
LETVIEDAPREPEVDSEDIGEGDREGYFQDILRAASDADIKYEYDSFLKALPKSLPLPEKERLVKLVSEKLKIGEVTKRLICICIIHLVTKDGI